jgi:superfamily II DNA or RNA helicase
MNTPHSTAAQAQADALLWIPFGAFTRTSADTLRRRLTCVVRGFRDDAEDVEIRNYVLDRDAQRVGVPIHFGLQLLQSCSLRGAYTLSKTLGDGRAIAVSKFPDPHHPKASPNQAELMSAVLQHARGSMVTLVESPTGSGKTVVALNTIGRLQRAALIIVTNKVLAAQWRREAALHLGLADGDIGLVEGAKCEYLGKAIVVAVIHNLVMKPLPEDFVQQFGIVVWDEAHRLGAVMFSQSLKLFPCKHRIALTATPTRKDGAECLFLDYFGPPAVHGLSDALPCTCRVVNFDTYIKDSTAMSSGELMNRLVHHPRRNDALVAIIQSLYLKGRHVLVLSDRVKHLQLLMRLCAKGARAIQAGDMGLFCRSYKDGKKKKQHNAKQLALVSDSARVVFSTYGMGKEGLDIARLDAGLDATPRADGVQAIGRIRRPLPNKPRPVWFTIRDKGVPLLCAYTGARLREYRENNVEVIDHE